MKSASLTWEGRKHVLQYGPVLSPHLSPLHPEVALLKRKLELMEGRREITLVWLCPSPQDGTLRLFAATWWMSVKAPGPHKSLSFLNAYFAPGPLYIVFPRGDGRKLCRRLNHLPRSWLLKQLKR